MTAPARATVVVAVPRKAQVPELFESLKRSFPDVSFRFYDSLSGPVPAEAWKDAEVVVTWDKYPTSRELAPKLRLIQLTSAGCNHLKADPIYADPHVAICTANGSNAPQIAEWVLLSYLNFSHRTYHLYDEGMQKQTWLDIPYDSTSDLSGKRIGILGYGGIGRHCSHLARAFGMEVYAYTMRERATPESRVDDSYFADGMGDVDGLIPQKWFHGTTQADINKMLAEDLDCLLICLPLTEMTHNLIGKKQFELLAKPGKTPFLINVARGPIVNSDDLYDALETGVLGGAALDVTDPEPLPPGHKLWHAKNIFITPHISFLSKSHMARIFGLVRGNLRRLLDGKAMMNEVDRKLGY